VGLGGTTADITTVGLITASGRVTASAFAGDGSALTNLPTGTSGSAFENITASGTASITNLRVINAASVLYNTDNSVNTRIYSGSTTPSSPNNGDIWIDSTDGVTFASAQSITIGSTNIGIGSTVSSLYNLSNITASGIIVTPDLSANSITTGTNNIIGGTISVFPKSNSFESSMYVGIARPAIDLAVASALGSTGFGLSALSSNGFNVSTEDYAGAFNSAFGAGALTYNISGSGNTAIGYNALGYLENSGSAGFNNIAIGANAGSEIISGSNNLIIGLYMNGTETLNDSVIISTGLGQKVFKSSFNTARSTSSEISGPSDRIIPSNLWILSASNRTVSTGTTLQPIFDPDQAQIPLSANMVYKFEVSFSASTATSGATTFAFDLVGAGNANVGTYSWVATVMSDNNNLSSNTFVTRSSTSSAIVSQSIATALRIVQVSGTIRTTASTTIAPSFKYSSNVTASVYPGAYFSITPLSTGSATIKRGSGL
jgi:hypothetical protein